MKIDGRLPIATIAAEIPGATSVFEALGIDYACAGNLSLEDAAHAAGIAPAVVLSNVRRLRSISHAESWADRPLGDLVLYLTAQHHRFVRDELASIALRLADLCTSRIAGATDLLPLRSAFTRLSDMILPHLHREEETVFPTLEALERSWQAAEPLPGAHSGLHAQLQQLENEHEAISDQLRAMRQLRLVLADSNELSPECVSILGDLATLEAHLHEYMFLENCVLIPRGRALQGQTNAVHSAAGKGVPS